MDGGWNLVKKLGRARGRVDGPGFFHRWVAQTHVGAALVADHEGVGRGGVDGQPGVQLVVEHPDRAEIRVVLALAFAELDAADRRSVAYRGLDTVAVEIIFRDDIETDES